MNAGDATEPLHQVKLLSALRSGKSPLAPSLCLIPNNSSSGDAALILPFLTEINKDRRKSEDADINTGAAALHLAIRCASGK
jgi:hypothetical protein